MKVRVTAFLLCSKYFVKGGCEMNAPSELYAAMVPLRKGGTIDGVTRWIVEGVLHPDFTPERIALAVRCCRLGTKELAVRVFDDRVEVFIPCWHERQKQRKYLVFLACLVGWVT